jgi:two-component system, sensor histidine kinase RegB
VSTSSVSRTVPLDAPRAARAGRPPAADSVALAWLVTARWTTLVAGAGAMVAGYSGFGASMPIGAAALLLGVFALSNGWLTWRVRTRRTADLTTIAGALVCADVLLLSWLLLESGSVLNPVSVFLLVQIVLAALVLGRLWTWVVTALAVGGYAALFLVPSSELSTAQSMHPEIGLHMRGMWLAFTVTALAIGALVTQLARAIEERDLALERLRDRNARAMRFASLTTLAAGAAHELSSPLATIAVAARELEQALERRTGDQSLHEDARLIRSEIDRCRRVLDDMAGRIAEPMGEGPRLSTLGEALTEALARVNAADRARVILDVPSSIAVVWPVGIVAHAVANLVTNGLQASRADQPVRVMAGQASDGRVVVVVSDRGRGMAADELARAGEPFFTTKLPGTGTGLGLFVARSAVEQLGGKLTLESRRDEGTTATIVLDRDVVQGDHAGE